MCMPLLSILAHRIFPEFPAGSPLFKKFLQSILFAVKPRSQHLYIPCCFLNQKCLHRINIPASFSLIFLVLPLLPLLLLLPLWQSSRLSRLLFLSVSLHACVLFISPAIFPTPPLPVWFSWLSPASSYFTLTSNSRSRI